jgi:hypothetical protein
MPGTVKIYCLFDKRDKIPRYIGSTDQLLLGDRLSQHLSQASLKRGTKKDRWILEVGIENVGIRYLDECYEHERLNIEEMFIKLYSEFNLVNSTYASPGEGTLGEYLKKKKETNSGS